MTVSNPPPARRSTASQALEDLVCAAADGDRAAQQHLMERYWAVIEQAVRGRKNRMGQRLAAREETQDLAQSAAIKVLGELDKHSWQGRSAFAAWVKKLARYEVVDAYRHHSAKKRDAAAELPQSRADRAVRALRSAESVYDAQHAASRLLDEVRQLKPEYGAALLMHHLGFSHAEIGESLGCTAEAARKLVSRGRTSLLKLRK